MLSVEVSVPGVLGSVGSGVVGSVGSVGSVEGYVHALPSQVPPLSVQVFSASFVSSFSSSFLHVPASESYSPPSASQASLSLSSDFLHVWFSSSHSPPPASQASCASLLSDVVSPFDLNSSLMYPPL